MYKRAVIFLIMLMYGLLLFAHPIKMTVSKLSVNTNKQEISYAINLFIDDFVPVLKETYSYEPWDFTDLSENEIRLLTRFISTYISITINQEPILIHQIEMQISEENVCQIQFTDSWSGTSKITSIRYSNTILMENYATQSNIVHILIDDKSKKTYNLTRGNALVDIKF